MKDWETALPLTELETAASYLKEAVASGIRIFIFSGEVGSGKTSLIKITAKMLGVNTPVQSPTFGILHAYSSDFGPIQHSDWYRIKEPQELIEMGLHEALETDIWMIEWPEIGMELLKEYAFVYVHIESPIDQPQASYRNYKIIRHKEG